MVPVPACRSCGEALTETLVDLGLVPLANDCIPPDRTREAERLVPLQAFVCSDCRLVQLGEFGRPHGVLPGGRRSAAMSDGRARSSEAYAERMIDRFCLGPATEVSEIGSDDGLLLEAFLRRGIPGFGVHPVPSAAAAAAERGIPTEIAVFGAAAARRLRAAGAAPVLIAAGDMLARAADPHDLVEGFRELLAPGGVLALEFQHLLPLVQDARFDAIDHGRVSYLSLMTAEMLLSRHGLTLFDAEELPAFGGSLRIYARHAEDRTKPVTDAVQLLRVREIEAGLGRPEVYRAFADRVVEAKCALLDFIVGARRARQRVVGYGVSAKGDTLLNYCGIGPELLPFTVDPSPGTQGMLLPGTRIPVRPPEALLQERPDFVLVLSWHTAREIEDEMGAIRDWGGRFVVPTPKLHIF